MPRAAKIFRSGIDVNAGAGCDAPFQRGDAGGGGYVIHRYGEGCFVVVGVISNHLWELQLFAQLHAHRHTDQAFAVHCHKVYVFSGGKLGGADKIAFVFPVSVIGYQNNFALP